MGPCRLMNAGAHIAGSGDQRQGCCQIHGFRRRHLLERLATGWQRSRFFNALTSAAAQVRFRDGPRLRRAGLVSAGLATRRAAGWTRPCACALRRHFSYCRLMPDGALHSTFRLASTSGILRPTVFAVWCRTPFTLQEMPRGRLRFDWRSQAPSVGFDERHGTTRMSLPRTRRYKPFGAVR